MSYYPEFMSCLQTGQQVPHFVSQESTHIE